MSLQQETSPKRDDPTNNSPAAEAGSEEATTTFLPLTATPLSAAPIDQSNTNKKISFSPSHEHEGRNDIPINDTPPPAKAPSPQPILPHQPSKETPHSTAQEDGHDRKASTSSIWATAAASLKNLVMVKPQPQPPSTEIVTVVPYPRTPLKLAESVASQGPVGKLDKGKGKATAPDATRTPLSTENILPVLEAPQNKQRPPAPPPRLSSISHSLPTTSFYPPLPPHPPPPSHSTTSHSSTSHSSIQSPLSTFHTSGATDTSATTATDEENQAAALVALNAVIHSVGTGYTQPLTTRAAQLHTNDVTLGQQREKLLATTNLLARDTESLRNLALESNQKLKSFGDLHNWSSVLDNDLNAIEETLRLVERGDVETCAKCEGVLEDGDGGEGERGEQRWCGVCGKGFHRSCAGPEGEEEYHEEQHHEEEDGRGRRPEDVALPSSVPSTSVSTAMAQHNERNDIAAMFSLLSSFSPAATAPQYSVPAGPKPSSMFEWGGLPSHLLEDEDGDRDGREGSDGSEGSKESDWTEEGEGEGEEWRCAECRLRSDLDGIVMGL